MKFDIPTNEKSIIKVIGVGGGGGNAVLPVLILQYVIQMRKQWKVVLSLSKFHLVPT